VLRSNYVFKPTADNLSIRSITAAGGGLTRRWAPVKRLIMLVTFALFASTSSLAVSAADELVPLQQLRERGYSISEPLSLAAIEQASLEQIAKSPHAPQVPFGLINAQWEEFKSKAKSTDVILRVRSPSDSWQSLAGWAGLVLVRDGIIIASITERVS
jgi:hypothetical protein